MHNSFCHRDLTNDAVSLQDGNLWVGKLTAVVSAGGGKGGARAQAHLRDINGFLKMQLQEQTVISRIFSDPSPFVSYAPYVVCDQKLCDAYIMYVH